jgi:hypothetical protein
MTREQELGRKADLSEVSTSRLPTNRPIDYMDGGPFISEQSNHYWRALHAGWHSAVAGPLLRLPSAQDYGYGPERANRYSRHAVHPAHGLMPELVAEMRGHDGQKDPPCHTARPYADH